METNWVVFQFLWVTVSYTSKFHENSSVRKHKTAQYKYCYIISVKFNQAKPNTAALMHWDTASEHVKKL